MKLPPVRTAGREHAREVPYMRYGHTAVLLEDDVIYIWGGRNDTAGACNVLYAFDVSKYTHLHLSFFWWTEIKVPALIRLKRHIWFMARRPLT